MIPTYTYVFPSCGHTVEVEQNIKAEAFDRGICPHVGCGYSTHMKRLIPERTAVVFKGRGWTPRGNGPNK